MVRRHVVGFGGCGTWFRACDGWIVWPYEPARLGKWGKIEGTVGEGSPIESTVPLLRHLGLER